MTLKYSHRLFEISLRKRDTEKVGLSFALKEPRVVALKMVGGREFRSEGLRKEKDISSYDGRWARETRREVVLEDLKDRAGG
jgi:hypothetical protein